MVKSLPEDKLIKTTTTKLEILEDPQEFPQQPTLHTMQPFDKPKDVSSEQSTATLRVPILQLTTELVPPLNSEQNILSVIAEDEDEEPSEHNDNSTSMQHDELPKSPLVVPQAIREPEMSPRRPSLQNGSDISPKDETASMSSIDTFHSMPLDLPGEHISQTKTVPQTIEVLPIEDHKEISEPLSLQSFNDKGHDMTDVQEEAEEISQKLMDKPNPASFPLLPEPMPLRKSMKPPRDPSMNAVLLGAATPGVPVGGKRTSWLMKLREAKALEGLSNKPHPPGVGSGVSSSSFLVLQGTKRKSDHFSLPQIGTRDDERPPKVAKTSAGETVSFDLKNHSSRRTPEPVNMVMPSNTKSQSQPSAIVESAQEGVLDRLKKTVEGLGVRVGQTMGKSIGSDTATVLAEARAAAKAKVVERDRKEEELTMALPASEPVEHKTVARQEGERRLSISDLFPAEGRVKEKHKAPEKLLQFMPSTDPAAVHATTRPSTSTTPPHSPPQQSHSFTIPSGPVFSKPPPVFVPPIPVATKPITSTSVIPDALSKVKGLSTTALGFSPSLPPSLPKATNIVPLTAHSTLESIGSDIVFDRDDIPAWMPSTQDTEYTTYGSQSQPKNNEKLDEDDSWPIDEKLAAGVQWTFGGTCDVDMEDDYDSQDHPETQDAELEELVLSAPKFTGPIEVRRFFLPIDPMIHILRRAQ